MKKNKEDKKKIFQKIVVGFIIFAVVFVFDFWLFSPKEFSSEQKQEQEQEKPVDYPSEEEIDEEEENFNPEVNLPIDDQELGPESEELEKEKEEISLPNEIKIKNVPFLVQSPFAKWDDLHNEACEEAVLIMALYWLKGEKLDKETGNQEILDSVKWQEKKWGGHYDLPVKNIVELAREYFGMEKIYYTSVESINDIKRELNKGNLVVLPTAGRLLNNPYYTQPGPAYHAILLTGYQKNKIIAHDPGTKRGENYTYDQDVVFQSIHDWPLGLEEGHRLEKDEKAEEVLKGEKMMIVVERNE